MEYHVEISPLMRAVNQQFIESCIGVNHCISQHGRNLIVEVPKPDLDQVVAALKEHFPDVVDIRKAYAMLDDLHDFILVKPLISEAPLMETETVTIPSLEKVLVDGLSDKEYASGDSSQQEKAFQRAFEQYDINLSRLLRYAARKGKKEEVLDLHAHLDYQRIDTIKALCKVMTDAPILRAWLFGSFARGEEGPDSDLDILVDLDKQQPIGLLGFSGLIHKMEKATGREIDLIPSGSLKPFAIPEAERDKYLIYERAQ